MNEGKSFRGPAKSSGLPEDPVNIPDFSWSKGRSAGVFLHISSLPSEWGIGNVGGSAEAFFDFLETAGMRWWQMCPLGPTGYGDSPYQSFSAFAGNPYFIDLEDLTRSGLLKAADVEPLRRLPRDFCDYGAVYAAIPALLRKAAFAWRTAGSPEGIFDYRQSFKSFSGKNASWLEPYSLFSAYKRKFGGKPWYEWPQDCRFFKNAAKIKRDSETVDEIFAVKFCQWIFFCQFEKFREKAESRGIKIFGDLPIFVAHDSADVWENPEIFELNKDGSARNVAGVGPDYFSAEGQLWGNPLYDWRGAKTQVYEFWRRRISAALSMYDAVRLDHFRGFADYWSIPAKSNDARKGSWKLGPGMDFFRFLKRNFPKNRFVAEDLGMLSKRARELRDKLNMPSMAVMQFAFGDAPSNPYFPHNVRRNCVYYTGTHDNDTACGWYASAGEDAKDQLRRYFRSPGDSPNWDMIHALLLSAAQMAVIPMQDILGLPSECRMNTPGKAGGNWRWRMTCEQLEAAKNLNAPYLKSLAHLGGRLADY